MMIICIAQRGGGEDEQWLIISTERRCAAAGSGTNKSIRRYARVNFIIAG